MSRRIARRLAALARTGRPRIRVAAINGYHADRRAFTVRLTDRATADDSTEGIDTDGQS